jgi:putative membrane protein
VAFVVCVQPMAGRRIEPRARSANRHTEAVGVGLVILGLVIMCGAIWHYLHVANNIDRQTARS